MLLARHRGAARGHITGRGYRIERIWRGRVFCRRSREEESWVGARGHGEGEQVGCGVGSVVPTVGTA